jgi:hypothetical protein
MWVNLNNCVLSFTVGDFLLECNAPDGNELPEYDSGNIPRYLVTATQPVLELTPVYLQNDAYILQNDKKVLVEEFGHLANGGWWIDMDY